MATTLGGTAWDTAGPIWYRTLCDPNLRANATFSSFARITLTNAAQLYGAQSAEADAVRASWDAVKVRIGSGQ